MSKNLRSGNVYILKLNSLDGRLESIEIGRHSYSYVLEKKKKEKEEKEGMIKCFTLCNKSSRKWNRAYKI